MKPTKAQLWTLLSLLLFFSCRQKEAENTSTYWDSHPLEANEMACFLFIVPDCPLAMNYSKEFMQLYRSYSDSGVLFTGVIPGDLYTSQEINAFIEQYGFDVPLIIDKELQITEEFGATVSPEVFVYNSYRECLYHGKMDEWVKDLGSKYGAHGRNFAKEAISAGLNGRYPEILYKAPIGCSLEIE